MNIKLLPTTKTGKWAVNLILLFIILMFLKFLNNFIRLPFPSPLIAVIGVVGSILGAVAFVKQKERSILVFLSIIIGLLIVFWVGAELAFPH